MKYHATVEAYEVKTVRTKANSIVKYEPEGPIREWRGTFVYDYPAGKMNQIRLGEVLVIWPCGIRQTYNKKHFEELFTPLEDTTTPKPKAPRARKVILDPEEEES